MIYLEWVGAILGVIGTFYLSRAASKKNSFIAFCMYSVCNVLISITALHSKMYGVACMQAIYILFSVRGLWNNRYWLAVYPKTPLPKINYAEMTTPAFFVRPLKPSKLTFSDAWKAVHGSKESE